MRLRALSRSRSLRILVVLAVAAGVGALVWWRGPDWGAVGDAFTIVRWQWVVAAIALNLVSVLVRAVAWSIVINQAMPPPHPQLHDARQEVVRNPGHDL